MEAANIRNLDCVKGKADITCTDRKSNYQIRIVPDVLTNRSLVFVKGKKVDCNPIKNSNNKFCAIEGGEIKE